MSRRAFSKYLNLEAESGSEDEEDYQVSEYSEDLDNVVTAPKIQKFSDMTKELENKYRVDSSEEYDEDDEVLISEESVVEGPSQTQLLPTPKSPLLFLIRCKPGKEKNVLLRILDNIKSNEICSVIQKDGLKGYIYLESYKKQAVEDLLSSLRNVARRKIGVVPYKEMVEAISYKKNFIVTEFARIKTGKYKGDLVQIVEDYEDCVKVRLIPRINDSKKYFDPAEFRNQYIEKDGGYIFNRDFYMNGFLIKTMLKSNLDFEVDPTFEELEGLQIKKHFDINDRVKVKRGDLINFIGKIEHISGNSATISSNDKRYEINVNDIEKYYTEGEEVSYKGINGIVLKVEGSSVIIGINDLSDEMRCSITDLKPPVATKMEFRDRVNILRGRKDPLVNSKVIVKNGEFKGLQGIIKDVYKNTCRVQLNTSLKDVNVDRSDLQFLKDKSRFEKVRQVEGKSIETAETEGFKTPGYKTPGFQTPGYKTPGFQTPGYKTPGYKTPGFQTPGYKTPRRLEDNEYISKRKENTGTEWLTEKSVYNGVVVNINGKETTISDLKDDKLLTVSGESINKSEAEYVIPEKYENLVIMEGKHKGIEGILIGIKGEDYIVRSLNNGEIFNLSSKEISKKM